jgi:hypothetical protein
MFRKLGSKAEKLATSCSRREFLGRFGRGAMAAAATAGAVLALPAFGWASPKPPGICTGGDPGCIGMPMGSPCGGGRDGGTGNCQPPKHDRNSTICECR